MVVNTPETIHMFLFPSRDTIPKKKTPLGTLKTLGNYTGSTLYTVTLHYNDHCNHSKGIRASTSQSFQTD